MITSFIFMVNNMKNCPLLRNRCGSPDVCPYYVNCACGYDRITKIKIVPSDAIIRKRDPAKKAHTHNAYAKQQVSLYKTMTSRNRL